MIDEGGGGNVATIIMILLRFIKSGASSHYGSFEPGDMLRCSEDHARHLIDVARVAVAVESDAPPQKRATKRARR